MDLCGKELEQNMTPLNIDLPRRQNCDCSVVLNGASFMDSDPSEVQWRKRRFFHPQRRYFGWDSHFYGAPATDSESRLHICSQLLFLVEINFQGVSRTRRKRGRTLQLSTLSDYHRKLQGKLNVTLYFHIIGCARNRLTREPASIQQL